MIFSKQGFQESSELMSRAALLDFLGPPSDLRLSFLPRYSESDYSLMEN